MFLVACLIAAAQCYLFAQAALTVQEVAFWSDLGLSDAAIASKLAVASPRPRFSEADLTWLQSTGAKPGLIETIRPYVPKDGTSTGPADNSGERGGSTSKDLTGLWRNPGGAGVYRVRQIGSKLVWGFDAVSIGSYANMFQGQINGDTIDGVWEDLPGSPTIGGGRMLLKIESECRFVRVSSVNRYGADIWVKKDSTCDVGGQAQRTNAVGAKPTTTTTKPVTPATNKQTGPVVVVDDPSGVFEKPKTITQAGKPQTSSKSATATTVSNKKPVQPEVEEPPDDRGRTNTATTKTGNKTNNPPPVDQETPEDTSSTKTGSNIPGRPRINPATTDQETPEDNSSTKTAANTPARRRIKTAKPVVEEPPDEDVRKPTAGKRTGNTGETETNTTTPATNTQPTDQQQPTEQQPTQQPNGQCRGGSYWLGTPTPNSWVVNTPGGGILIPWSTPIGVRGASLHVFSGGRDLWGANALPENANDCGLTYPLYPPAAGYYDAYLYDPSGRPVAGPVRFVVTPRQ